MSDPFLDVHPCTDCDFFSCKVFGPDGEQAGKCFAWFEERHQVKWVDSPQLSARCERFMPITHKEP